MKMRPKEILKNKSDKMIDLIIDEIEDGGTKEITASFIKNGLKYSLTVQVKVEDEKPAQSLIEDFTDDDF